MGVIAYNTYLFPPSGQIGTVIEGVVGGKNLPETPWTVDLTKEETPGIKQIYTPYGVFPFIVSNEPDLIEVAGTAVAQVVDDSSQTRDTQSAILFQTKCVKCHEMRSPSNRALSSDEWVTTITRMASKDNSDISPLERDQIITYVREEAQRLGELMAKQIQSAQEISIPGAISGRISEEGEVDYYKFTIPEGMTLGNWWVIHPFDNIDESGFDTVFPPELEIDFNKEYIGKGRRKIGWYKTSGVGESVFSNVPEDDVTGYAVTYIESSRDRVEILSLGSDDGIKVWVNDELILSKYIHRPLRAGDDVIALPLKKGKNKVLIKVINGYGPWGFLATISGYAISLSAEQINSPLSPAMTLLNASGEVLANNAGFAGRRNARIDYGFAESGTYALRVEDIGANGGDSYVYHLGMEPATPDFAISVTPDNPNIGRGGTILLTVNVLRRVGFTGEIALTVENLPSGVTASSSAIVGNLNQGYITLTANADAELGHAVVEVVGTIKTVAGEEIKRPAIPVEVYLIQNQQLTVQRSSIVVSVREAAPTITVSTSPQHIKIGPDTRLPLKVTVNRTGPARDLTLSLVGLPIDVRPERQFTILRSNQSETTIMLETQHY